ncbi:MAG: hypothetical protein ABF629_15570 [Sporolactobacillus sp.]
MEEAMVFGGLSSIGFLLTERLLEAGVVVYSISSAVTDEEKDREEENELFLGRNALFHNDRDKPRSVAKHLILADTFRMKQESNDELKKKMGHLLTDSPQCQRVLFLSSLEVCGQHVDKKGKRRAACPTSVRGRAANEMELFFINLLHESKRKEAIILRTDLNLISDKCDGEIIAALINGLMEQEHEGLDVVHFKKGLDSNDAINEKLRSLLPRNYEKWLQRKS